VDYSIEQGPSKYMIGTEQGTVLMCSKNKKNTDKIQFTWPGHHGPVYSVRRNPVHHKYFLTVGDWTARLWAEEKMSTAMYTTYYNKTYLTCGAWHPSRVGVFFTTRLDGCMDCWDLMYRQNAPVLTVQVSDYALHTFKPAPGDGQHVAIGSVDGCTTLLELSPHLYQGSKRETDAMAKMFDNEAQRDRNLMTRARDTKARKARDQKEKGTENKEQGVVPQDQLDLLTSHFLDDIAKHEKEDKDRQEAQLRDWQSLIERIEGGADEPDEDLGF